LGYTSVVYSFKRSLGVQETLGLRLVSKAGAIGISAEKWLNLRLFFDIHENRADRVMVFVVLTAVKSLDRGR
jgi:hypothetical protein